jgi:hypothetical protein
LLDILSLNIFLRDILSLNILLLDILLLDILPFGPGHQIVVPFQQVQPANNRPVYVPSPHPPSHKEFTLYFSGKAPGEFTTKVTALPVDQVTEDLCKNGKING